MRAHENTWDMKRRASIIGARLRVFVYGMSSADLTQIDTLGFANGEDRKQRDH